MPDVQTQTNDQPRVHIHVVHLPEDQTRWKQLATQFQNAGIPSDVPVTHYAVHGKTLTDKQLAKYVSGFYRPLAVPSVVGCALSHKHAWALAKTLSKKHAADWLLVLEDDVEFVQDAWRILHRDILPTVPSDTDVLLLGYIGTGHPYTFEPTFLESVMGYASGTHPRGGTVHSEDIYTPYRFAGAHGYLIRCSSAVKLLRAMPRVEGHVDMQMSRAAAAGKFHVRAVSASLVWQAYQDDSHNSTPRPFLLNKAVHCMRLGNDPTSPPLDTSFGYKFFRLGPYHGTHSCFQAWHAAYFAAGALAGYAVPKTSTLIVGLLVMIAFLAIADPVVAKTVWGETQIPKPLDLFIDTATLAVGFSIGVLGYQLRQLMFR